MLVIDDQTPGTAPKPSIFLHGVTGAGKSTWATAGGRPLVILTEPKAMSILRQVNPRALGLVPQSTKDILDLFTRLGQPEWLASRTIDRIVLDSFTDLTYTLPSWMKNSAEILLKMEIQEFGDLKNYALAMVKAIQLTGLPSIIIARSTVKKVGRVEKIVPDGYGKSVEELPGKCLPTVESRYDAEIGYLIDSTPDECSQRCGLPWVPQRFQGSALEFLALVEQAGPTPAPTAPVVKSEPAPATPAAGPVVPPVVDKVNAREKVQPLEHSAAWNDTIIALVTAMQKAEWSPADQKDTIESWASMPESALPRLEAFLHTFIQPSVGATLASLPPLEQPPVPPAAENFADEVALGHVFVTVDEAAYIQTLLGDFPTVPFCAYLASVGHLIPAADGSLRVDRILQSSYEKTLKPILKTEQRRHGMFAFIKQNFPTTTAA